MEYDNLALMDLQHFAEGAGAPAGGEGASGAGEGSPAATAAQPTATKYKGIARYTSQPDPEAAPAKKPVEEKAPAQEEPAQEAPTPDPDAEFEELIKGKYKDQFQKRTDGIINRRFAQTKGLEEAKAAVDPLLARLAARYGKDVNDLKGLTEAMDADDVYMTAEAEKRGMTPEQFRPIYEAERQIATTKQLEAQVRAREAAMEKQRQIEEIQARWGQQAQEARQYYKGLSLEQEMRNPAFRDLLAANIPVKTAYEVIHKDELMGGALTATSQMTRKRMAEDIQARGMRPAENGTSGQPATVPVFDYNKLSDAALAEIRQRTRRGDRITPADLISYMNKS